MKTQYAVHQNGPKKYAMLMSMILTSGLVAATEYNMFVIDENGNGISSCGVNQVATPIQYYDSSCMLKLHTINNNDLINVHLGPCPTSHKIKIIIDDHMYKYNTDASVYKDVFNSDDVIYINEAISNCTGGTEGQSELQLYTATDVIDLDAGFGMKWGHDGNNKPMLVMKSTTGNVVCDYPTAVTVNDGDMIFENGFE